MEHYKYLISGHDEKAASHGDKWDTVFLGGLLGSLFSFLQFLVSPIIGRASDRFGRRKVLLYTMVMVVFFSFLYRTRRINGESEKNATAALTVTMN